MPGPAPPTLVTQGGGLASPRPPIAESLLQASLPAQPPTTPLATPGRPGLTHPLTQAEENEELEADELLAVQLQRMQLQHQLLCPQHQAMQQGACLGSHRGQLHLGGRGQGSGTVAGTQGEGMDGRQESESGGGGRGDPGLEQSQMEEASPQAPGPLPGPQLSSHAQPDRAAPATTEQS